MRLILYIFGIIGISACSAPTYSCDPEIDNWVTQNINRVKTLTRADWLDIDNIEYQRGAYGAFSVEQKVKLWIEKFDEALKLGWNETEYKHIKRLQEEVQNHSIWFQPNCSGPDLNCKELFMYKWIDYAANKLRWSNEPLYALEFTPKRLAKDKTLTRLSNHIPMTTTRSESLPRCDCHNPESAHYISCSIEDHDCISGDCNVTTWRCGWLWSEECNGLCYQRK